MKQGGSFNEVFLGYQLCQGSDDDDRYGPQNVGSIQTPNMANSP
jgi:hypothetical protein